MALYGDIDHVKRLLAASGATYDADHDDRLTAIQAAVSAAIEDDTGRSFGAVAADETVLMWGADSDVLILPRPLRTITTLTVGGTVEGGTMTGGTVYGDDLYIHEIVDRNGLIYALRLTSGWTWGEGTPITITGDFAGTDDDADVPDDLTYAANRLIAETFKAENLPIVTLDGEIVPRRNPWTDPIIKAVLTRYRINPARELVL
jgi:hypothetical protein